MRNETSDLTIAFIKDFHRMYMELKNELPYSFNILDIAKANENTHSKLLAKLLMYKEGEKYLFLESFFQYIGIDETIIKPKIRVEKGRIDTSIEDEGYAVIIENKIHYAPDQEKQIKRYVDKLNPRYKTKQIYVLYLTRRGGNPGIDSLPIELKDELSDRYKAINYLEHILPWLKKAVLSICSDKTILLVNGVEQYIDHLEGLFKIRKNMEEMNKKLIGRLEKELKLNEIKGSKEKLQNIKTIENEINSLSEYLKKIKTTVESVISKKEFKDKQADYIEFFKTTLFAGNKTTQSKFEAEYWWIGVEMEYQSKRFLCGIGYDNKENQSEKNLKPYFGISCRPDEDINKQNKSLKGFIQKRFKKQGYINTKNWYVLKRVEFDKIEAEFKEFFDEVKDVTIISNTKSK